MTIVGFGFTKILSSKDKAKGNLKVTNNVTLTDVEKANMEFPDNSQLSLIIKFRFTSDYKTDSDEKVGNIELEGNIVYMAKKEEGEKILEKWKKDKKIETTILEMVMNYILDRCNIEAILLSREIGLPAPLKLPRIATKKE